MPGCRDRVRVGAFYPKRQVSSAHAWYCLATEMAGRGSYMEYEGRCGYADWGSRRPS
jgi:hypothetical protein